jgi:hypothetical protein
LTSGRETQRRRDLGRNERRVGDRGEGDKRHVTGECIAGGAGHGKRQARLADAARTGQRQQPVLPGMQQGDDGLCVPLPADERRALTRQRRLCTRGSGCDDPRLCQRRPLPLAEPERIGQGRHGMGIRPSSLARL